MTSLTLIRGQAPGSCGSPQKWLEFLGKRSQGLFGPGCRVWAGKGRFKEEFVTAGGVSLKEINSNTLRSKKYEDLYFAGEVLNIDAITGGFNLQAAWTTGYTVARAIASL